jgi:hypothetical protein
MSKEQTPLDRTDDTEYVSRVRRYQERSSRLVIAEIPYKADQQSQLDLIKAAAEVVINPHDETAIKQWQSAELEAERVTDARLEQLSADLERGNS